MSTLKTINIQNPGSSTINIVTDTNGNVGIGTGSPVNKLNVVSSTGQVDNDGLIKAEYSGLTSTVNAGINVKNYNGTSQLMQWENYGVRIGSRIKTNTGAGGVYLTYGNDTVGMQIDSSGRILMPYQPCFYAYRTANWTTVPGVVIFDSTSVNIGGHYNTANGRFTAPVAGTYLLTLYIMSYITTNTFNDAWLRKNGGSSLAGYWLRPWSGNTLGAVNSMSAYITLAASDYIEFYVNNGPALYSDGNAWIRFGGHLIG